MLDKSAEWTGTWVAARLREKPIIQNVELLTPQILQVNRSKYPSFIAATIASSQVDSLSITSILETQFTVDFIINVPSEAFWTGEAISLASRKNIAFGGLGDLISACVLPDVRQHVNREFAFVERVFRQHSKITSFKREHDRKYIICRTNSDDLSIVLLNEYDLTADHVRTARDRYGTFSVILLTNPNGNWTESAQHAASSMGSLIFKFKNFLGWLNQS